MFVLEITILNLLNINWRMFRWLSTLCSECHYYYCHQIISHMMSAASLLRFYQHIPYHSFHQSFRSCPHTTHIIWSISLCSQVCPCYCGFAMAWPRTITASWPHYSCICTRHTWLPLPHNCSPQDEKLVTFPRVSVTRHNKSHSCRNISLPRPEVSAIQ